MRDPAPRTQEPATIGRRNIGILVLVSVVQLMVIIDASIVNVALPSIKVALNFSEVDLQWVINAYTLIFAGFLLLGGRAADLLGRRAVLIAGLVLFTGASLVCGLAQSSIMLELSRGVQGLGGAIISPAALSILLVTFREGAARNRALSVWGAVAGGGSAIGVILGGLLTQGPGWRWIFFVNVPIGILLVLAAPRILAESHGEQRTRSYDIPGAVTVTLALVLLVYAMVGTVTYGWGSARTIGELLAAALLFGIFVAIEGRFASQPLVPLRIFRSRALVGANVVALLLGLALFAVFYFLSLYMQQVLGFSPLRTGVAYLPITVGFIVIAGVASQLIGRVGAKWLLTIGMVITAAAFLLLARLPDQASYATDILPAFIVLPLGAGLAFISVTNAAVAGVAPRDSGLASALLNTSQQTGGAVGLGLLATIAASRTNSILAGNPHTTLAHALVQGFHAAFFVAAAIAAVGAIVAILTIPRSIGRVTQVASPAPSTPSGPEPQPVTRRATVPSGALAACALCSPVTRHSAIVETAIRSGADTG
ncbi:MAG: drug resistance transporter, EmrB/QacA subfamily [Chloroflexi bacterium]|nr:drug resistance transporter, EmrB/QacA subfamily [Chloroflexota bacterium]